MQRPHLEKHKDAPPAIFRSLKMRIDFFKCRMRFSASEMASSHLVG